MTDSRFFALNYLAAALVHTLDAHPYSEDRHISFGTKVANLLYRANNVRDRDLEEALRLVNEAHELLLSGQGKELEVGSSFAVSRVIEAIHEVCVDLKRNDV